MKLLYARPSLTHFQARALADHAQHANYPLTHWNKEL
jgi:hypothetical protein